MARHPATTAAGSPRGGQQGHPQFIVGQRPQTEIRSRQPRIDFNHHVVAAVGIVPQDQVDSQPTTGSLESRRNLPGQVRARRRAAVEAELAHRDRQMIDSAARRAKLVGPSSPSSCRQAGKAVTPAIRTVGPRWPPGRDKPLQTPSASRRRQHRQIVGAAKPTNVERTGAVYRLEHRRIGEIARQWVAG